MWSSSEPGCAAALASRPPSRFTGPPRGEGCAPLLLLTQQCAELLTGDKGLMLFAQGRCEVLGRQAFSPLPSPALGSGVACPDLTAEEGHQREAIVLSSPPGCWAGFLLGSHGLPGTGSFSQQISFVPVGTHWLLLEPRSHTRTWMASSCHPFFLCPLPPQSLRPCPSRKGAHLSHLAFHTQIPRVLWLSCSLFACLFMERRGDRSIPAPPVKRKEINTWGGGVVHGWAFSP